MQTAINSNDREEPDMAIQSAIPVSFDAYFPKGAFMVGEVEPVVKWSDDGQRQGQDLDKNSGQPMWQVRVIDADPDARKGQNEVTVKIISISEPVAPPEIQGLPFRPVVFDGLSVTPYVKENGGRPRVAYSLRAREMKAAAKPRGGE
ncbi:plasmid replication, integration and excision activator [Curtobacterium aurantiacum]|nr:plasmid replication, integration and excision activator [Curtobacterium flaccumfaciens]MBT1675969.1 plasmid replication, integration and excision activator [Curtobacterium flaccumfaciens pv. flaccumfaciens]